MTTPPGANTDTSGVVGNTGPVPIGSQATSASVKDTQEMGAGGSTTARPNQPGSAGTLATDGTDGTSATYAPVATLVAGTRDTTQGFAGNMSALAYRAPASGVPGNIQDTGGVLGFAAAVPTDTFSWVTSGTIETPNFGAPTGLLLTKTDAGTIDDTTPVITSAQGIFTNTIVVRKTTGNVLLVKDTDYTVTRVNSGDKTKAEIRRVGASATVAEGDAITVTYTYGDLLYWGTHDPVNAPPAPVIGTAVAQDRKIKVVWTLPGLGESDDVDGYLVQSSTGGTRYVPGGQLDIVFETVVPSVEYEFRVASFNEKGMSEFSDWSNSVAPLNFDAVPSVGLDPKNTINPIYNVDGTVVAGTGLGPS